MPQRLAARRHTYFTFLSALFFVTVLICGAIFCTGCRKTPKHSRVTGIVTFGRAGAAVAGATVTAVQEDGAKLASTKTDSEGRYTLLVKPGTKMDLIAAKEGYTGCRFQGIVLSPGETFRADLIMQKPVVSQWDTTPPRLAISGVTSGQTISEKTWITVELKGEHELGEVLWEIGSEFPGYSYKFPGGFRSVTLTLDTTGYTDGPSFIHIVAYDKNKNAVITRIPVRIKNDSASGVHLTMKKPLLVLAYTYGDDMHMSTMERHDYFPGLYRRQRGLPRAGGDFSITAAEERSTCYVGVFWEKEFSSGSGFAGYNVYRSSSAFGPWKRLGTAYEDAEAGEYYYFDLTPDVTPGVRSYYKVVPFSSGGKEGTGQTEWVVPLGRFEVNLKEPAHGATDVSLNPTLKWEHNGVEADIYFYQFELIGRTEEWEWEKSEREYSPWIVIGEMWTVSKDKTFVDYVEDVVDDTNEGVWGDNYLPLQKNWSYQWDIISAQAIKVYSYKGGAICSAAVSIGLIGQAGGSSNGAFVFSTGDAE